MSKEEKEMWKKKDEYFKILREILDKSFNYYVSDEELLEFVIRLIMRRKQAYAVVEYLHYLINFDLINEAKEGCENGSN